MRKSKEDRLWWTAFYHSPVRLLATMVLSIFVAEMSVMLFLHFVLPLPFIGEALVDASSLVLMLSPIFYFFLFRPLLLHITERKRTEEALRESETQIRLLSLQILVAQEIERRRISRELHDELGQALTLLKFRTRFIEKNLRADQNEAREECGEILSHIDRIIENVRRLSRDLSPAVLEDLGLTSALKLLVEDFAKHCPVETSFDIEDIDPLFSQEAQVFIYRVFQEALTNIGKYAEARHVEISLRKLNGTVSFLVEDDGRGFDLKEVMERSPSEKGMGLSAMSQRTRLLGGTFEISSEREKGTKIRFTLPVSGEKGL